MDIPRATGGDVYGELAIAGLPFNVPGEDFDAAGRVRATLEVATRLITAYVQAERESGLGDGTLSELRSVVAEQCSDVVGAVNEVVSSDSVELHPPIVILNESRLKAVIESHGSAEPHPEMIEMVPAGDSPSVAAAAARLLSLGLVPGLTKESIDELVARALAFVGAGADLLLVIDTLDEPMVASI